MDLSLQVKLLRVIETRRFAAVGDTAMREFKGKLIAATNRDLPSEIRAGRFREDLYYRLCADLIHTPSLADQIRDSPGVLHELLHYMTLRTVGAEAERCLPEIEDWIHANLPADYTWPGNYRELEQCVRNVIIRRSYAPIGDGTATPEENFMTRFRAGELTADQLLSYYAAQVYRITGSYDAAARRLGKQWAIAARLVEGHNLVTDGPYSFVRNPIYTGMFGMLIASGLAFERWITLPIAIVVFAVGLVIRVRTEEKLLRGAFGQEFEDYAKRVPAVIPGIY